ncbi:hypothetical protein Kpol_460p23 [Vanderwaltozyma polyspora DSM 70294]|uniref:Bud22 domain-containing protein n=1 Tax=Vanderwaltozyma polyspora (strain ATCC 22028 / DSM 70294 / BCRC 21397 / CBS 2163 / NBRC 10782 / NRRL Y-8283 / UCD 57-17) TaxID=436907 RepID=A7TQT9_VANPO|nr:uncharacterized protein Kpol_460p23 [Vanderwaltozyma polyspora DSM 70294]EDO15388.1 hypothetical protein Kpol_460p23 [Vanderwaltozyma polyspora DSM 70294]
MPKDNLLFKLDNLEYQYYYLKGTLDNFTPRLNSTTKLYNAKGKKSAKKVEKVLAEITLPEVESGLLELRLEIFNNKLYHLEKNLQTFLLKHILEYEKKVLKEENNKNAKKKNHNTSEVIEEIKKTYGFEEFINFIIKSKCIKLASSKIIPTKHHQTLPQNKWFIDHEYYKIINDKGHKYNPGRIWSEVVMGTKHSDQIVSSLLNNKKCKELFQQFENGMDVFLAINKDKKKLNNTKQTDSDGDGNLDSSNGINKKKTDDDSTIESSESEDEMSNQDVELNDDDISNIMKQYEGVIVDSENESSNEDFVADPNIDYNQVTDEEMSSNENYEDEEDDEDSSDDEQPQKKKQKVQLPELMGGYYSGEEESDFEEDNIAKQQKSNKEKKKNRRGQRARRKIWEQKYGKEAKHVQRELEKEREERKQRQIDYEARVAKREAKARELAVSGTNLIEVGERKASKPVEKKEPNEDHPSWVAKKLAEEKLKNAKFTGKKITFD